MALPQAPRKNAGPTGITQQQPRSSSGNPEGVSEVNTASRMIGVLRRSVRRAGIVFATLLVLASTATAGTISLAWNPNPEPAVMGYVVYVGTAAGTYTASYDVGNATTFALTTAVPGTTYHIA